MKIAFFEANELEREYFSKELAEDDVVFYDEPLDEDFSGELADFEIASVFIYSKVTAKVLKKMPNLKMIVTRSTGFDHIDLEGCREKKILVTNIPSYGENTVAEHAFALILALSRKIVPSVERTRHGDYSVDGLRGIDLQGKTLGILGTGKIGSHLAKMACGFGLNILGYDKFKNLELVKKCNLKYATLEKILAQSDIISLNLRHTKETHHIINKETIAKIKPGAILINTARGGLIDTTCLVEALDKGILSGVGLDVLEDEVAIKEDTQILSKHFPKSHLMVNIANNILLRRPNVIITPHNAFNSNEAFCRIMDTTAKNIKNFIADDPINAVTVRD